MSDRKSTIGFVMVVAAVALLVYVLSFGPAMWLVDRRILPAWSKSAVSVVYYPIFWTSIVGPRPVREAVRWYAELGAKRRADPIFDDSSEAL
jgi:hypothetical protein